MASNSVVRARIDERTKREAAAALKKIGLTVSDAFRLLLVRSRRKSDCGPDSLAVSGGAGWIESTASRCGTCFRRASGSPALSNPDKSDGT